MKRLQKQFNLVSKMGQQGIAVKIKQSLFHWELTMKGPKQSPYEQGTFIVDIDFPTQFPFKFPHFKFRTPIWHPNIKQGQICKQMLGQTQWLPNKKVEQIIQTILSMLLHPDIPSAINIQAAKEFKEGTFNQKAKAHVVKYAKKSQQ